MGNFYDLLEAHHILFSRMPGGNTLITGEVDLSESDICHLPDNVLVYGSLSLRNCPQLCALPAGLHVLNDLDLRNTPIDTLPPDLNVGGHIFLENTRLAALPDDFSVDGSLDVEGTPLTDLPDNLYIDGYLNLRRTAISVLPDNWHVEGPLLLDVDNICSPLAWRRIPLDTLGEDAHILQTYFLGTSEVGSFFWRQVPDEPYVELFAAWVSGEIRIYAGRYFGTAGGFERLDISPVFRQAARECVTELAQRLGHSADQEAYYAYI